MVTESGMPGLVATQGSGDCGFGGGCGWWGFLILCMFFFGNGGFGGWGGNRGATTLAGDAAVAAQVDKTVWQANEFGQLENSVRGIEHGLADTAFALNNSIKDGSYANVMATKDSAYGTQAAIAQATAAIGAGINQTAWQMADRFGQVEKSLCCLGKAIDNSNYLNAMNTNAINTNVYVQAQRIIDTLGNSEKACLAERLNDSKLALMEARIVASQKPIAPVPAYTVQSPYASGSGSTAAAS